MNIEDFQDLKARLGDKFELLNVDHEDNEKYYVIAKKKDIWDGTEYFEASSQIHPILRIEGGKHRTVVISKHYGNTTERQWLIECCKPSTESAYVEQLKKEAISKKIIGISSLDISMMDGGELEDKSTEFKYRKDTDTFYWFGYPIYQQGKWATKVKERVILPSHVIEYLRQYLNRELSYDQIEHLKGNGTRAKAEFLAQQLEKYLNEEL